MIKDGKYLFIYSEINPNLNVLGHSLRHDHNLSAFEKKGSKIELLCHLEFERFSGIKHHNVAFYSKEEATEYLNKLLASFNLNLVDFTGIYGMNDLTDDETLNYSSISSETDFPYHTISHLYSSILDMKKFFYYDVLSLAYDAGPDTLLDVGAFNKPLFCGSYSKCGNIIHFPISSPGVYWLYLSEYFNMPEGTLMALASATKAESLDIFEVLPEYVYMHDKNKCVKAVTEIIDRIMSYTIRDEGVLYITGNGDDCFSDSEIRLSMVVKVIQKLSIQNVFNQLDKIIEKYCIDPKKTVLSLSGGFSLNCPTNTSIMKKYKFKEFMGVPCINDSGLSIGMGLYFFKKMMGRFDYKFEGAFYGYSDYENIDKTLHQFQDYIAEIEEGIEKIPYDIEKKPVIWIDGRAEVGPRALGHRSLIANPLKIDSKVLLNKYKQREWWRPVAPIILEEELDNWFDEAFSSSYMLNNFNVKRDKECEIPAVLHLDKSARVQTLNNNENPYLYMVIKQFQKITGVPIVCNTSLNDKGEPIVNTLAQAINFALRKKIEIIYAYGRRICLKNFNKFTEESCAHREDEPFVKHRNEKGELMNRINPYCLSEMDLLIYLFNPVLRRLDITKKNDYKKVLAIINRLKASNINLRIFENWSQHV